MSNCANQRFFDDPAERNRQINYAGGYGRDGVRGGMWPLTEDKLRPGEIIYRIGHSDQPMTKNMSSPWWMRDESFYAIVGASDASGTGLDQLFRMKCAVSYDFGVSDIVLEAVITQPLRVFAGHGRPVEDLSPGRRGQIWYGALEIAQMFIPGLRDFKTGLPSAIGLSAIKIVRKYKVTEYQRVTREKQRRITKRLIAAL